MDRPVLGRASAVAAMIAAGLGGTAAAAPTRFEPRQPIALVCTVSGVQHIRPALTPAQVCAIFKRRIDTELARTTRIASTLPARGNAIRVTVRIDGSRSAEASLLTQARGRRIQIPPLTQDVMDARLGLRDLENLAGAVARQLTASR